VEEWKDGRMERTIAMFAKMGQTERQNDGWQNDSASKCPE